jgi:hypothetical protein
MENDRSLKKGSDNDAWQVLKTKDLHRHVHLFTLSLSDILGVLGSKVTS